MKIEEQVLSIEQMKHLQELGVDTSDASMCWVAGEDTSTNEGEWYLIIPNNFLLPYNIPTYTIGDLIEKLPKHFYIKESPINICAINGSGAFQVWYDKVPKSCKSDGTIKNALYKLLCWVAENHKKTIGGEEMSRIICGECEHFDPDFDPYGLFDGYCDLYGRGRNKNSECYGR